MYGYFVITIVFAVQGELLWIMNKDLHTMNTIGLLLST